MRIKEFKLAIHWYNFLRENPEIIQLSDKLGLFVGLISGLEACCCKKDKQRIWKEALPLYFGVNSALTDEIKVKIKDKAGADLVRFFADELMFLEF